MRLRWHRSEGQRWPQPAGTVLWGQEAACPLQGQAAKWQCPFPAAGLCCLLPGMMPATNSPTLLGHAGVAPKDKQQQGASSRTGRRGPPSGARVLPKPTDTNAQALGVRRKQQHSSCLPCSSQLAVGLKWCQGL